jgi:hypothetical protein
MIHQPSSNPASPFPPPRSNLPPVPPAYQISYRLTITFSRTSLLTMSQRKKSLLIGINYTGSQNELRGCHQDVENVAEFLSYRGYSDDPRSQVILRDDMGGQYYPSGHNILVLSPRPCSFPSQWHQLSSSSINKSADQINTGRHRLARQRTWNL